MTAQPHSRVPWVEILLCIPVVAGIIYATWYYFQYRYLPQPYFYEPWGTYMDYISVASYAHNKDAFEVFGTIYPPLSFVLMKFTSWAPCYADSGWEEVRNCDLYGLSWLYIIYFVNIVLIALSYWKIDRRTAVPRTIALSIGLPTTYALERGNLLLFTLTCLILAYGPLIRSARVRWIFAGLAVNFKVYLIGTVFAQLLRRRWRWFEGALLGTLLVYLATYAAYGEGSPRQIYNNITSYASGFGADRILDLWYPSSFIPLRTLLTGDASFNALGMIGSRLVEGGVLAANVIYASLVLSILAAAVATWWRPQVVPMYRLVVFSIAIAVTTSEVGGYTQMLVLFFVFMEPWRGFGRVTALILGYVLCIGLEYPIERMPPIVRESYMSGGPVISHFALGIGSLSRPILFHFMVFALALVTIRDTWVDARRHGWRTPRLPRNLWRLKDRHQPQPAG